MLVCVNVTHASCVCSTLLGFGAQTTAYYIRCHDCHALWAQDPAAWTAWEEEMADTQQKLEAAAKAARGE
jgi:SWI/SNF-related matrix-associated actin-dependent regulator of chromatin subfamily A member 5